MYKILHLATGEYVKGNHSNDICSLNKTGLINQVLNSEWTAFVYSRGDKYLVEVISTIEKDTGGKYLPKYQFEVVEVLDV